MSVKINQLMRSGVISVDAATPIKEAAKVMTRNNVGLLVVMSNGRMTGVVSEKDIVRAVANGVNPSDPIEKITTKSVISVNHESSLHEAAELMHKLNIRHLVVVDDNNNPVGVVSIRDIVGESIRLRTLAEQGVVNDTEEPIPCTD
ncbi:CBS domain-containing protein [Caldivirga maquilingensis]|uniref:Putative signal transduction protein with CBS domains n=1 Tax=Caldivirga maquilingensis (strain ATCC 700844 / DSM 13496 / JCM 10307 / IC-167) TaxID=397948 RepID=A8MCD2_CALMQ|nr:CBS domain-containing protein [Caldivirga maquilingensis]ABW01438.1 putative signal transduction protein with CBS domains [Caldivirga maquilingensis IC-167]